MKEDLTDSWIEIPDQRNELATNDDNEFVDVSIDKEDIVQPKQLIIENHFTNQKESSPDQPVTNLVQEIDHRPSVVETTTDNDALLVTKLVSLSQQKNVTPRTVNTDYVDLERGSTKANNPTIKLPRVNSRSNHRVNNALILGTISAVSSGIAALGCAFGLSNAGNSKTTVLVVVTGITAASFTVFTGLGYYCNKTTGKLVNTCSSNLRKIMNNCSKPKPLANADLSHEPRTINPPLPTAVQSFDSQNKGFVANLNESRNIPIDQSYCI